MKRIIRLCLSIMICAGLLANFDGPVQAAHSPAMTSLAPTGVSTLNGVTRGTVTSLSMHDQTGAQNDPTKYVQLQTPAAIHKSVFSFSLPTSISPTNITAITILVNYKGALKAQQQWTFLLYAWDTKSWVSAGDNTNGTSANWADLSFSLTNGKRFVRSDGQIQLLVRSNNSAGDAKLDFLKLKVASATPYTPGPFPRLGMWWPNPWEQPLTAIGRYDFVAMSEGQEEFIAPIKKINPRIILLTATNACELAYYPNQPTWNDPIKDVPAEWFLTQVGTTLTNDINATQTSISVNALSVSDGSQDFALFTAGDAVLVEGESMLVTAVNSGTKTLTVSRGYIRAAASHTAGTRIAAHISFWPGSWLLNLSTFSAKAIIDPNIGPETWAEFNARTSANQLIAEPGWDGILVDRSDGNQSWLIGNSTARTIDPDQSNTLLTDYSAFDSAWNTGLRNFEVDLRNRLGKNKIIYTNWGYPNYDLLNGNNLEGFPMTNGKSYGAAWYQSVFGPRPGVGSYFNWMNNALSPNLTMVETYEDDGGPDPTGSGIYDNPFVKPGFVPNYRKMRFGLGTALLNNGYYSYEINTNGHGSLGLMWFDEYDNAGMGRGYLGYPVTNATRVWNTLPTPNLVSGGGFNSSADLNVWDIWADSGYAVTGTVDTNNPGQGSASLKLNVTQSAGTDWQASLSYEPIVLAKGTDYTLTFKARSSVPRNISMWAQKNSPAWNQWLDFGQANLSTVWKTYSISVPASGSDLMASLTFGVGETLGNVWIDDVKLQRGNLNVWRRNFEHGIVLVNATHSAVTIPLGGTFKKIKGKQAPLINNGASVTSVTIPAMDAIILLKP